MNLNMDEKVGGKMSLANMPFCQDTVELPENYVPSSKDIICGRGTLPMTTNDTLIERRSRR